MSENRDNRRKEERKYRNKGHSSPSRYRDIVREAKKGSRDIQALINEAGALDDPYYSALALFALSSHPSLEIEKARLLASGAIKKAGMEKRGWRKAELLTELTRKIPHWREGNQKKEAQRARAGFYRRIEALILEMPEGKGLSDAVEGAAPAMPAAFFPELLKLSLMNRGYELQDGKAVLRAWVARAVKENKTIPIREIISILRSTKKPEMEARLLGYLHLQIKRAGLEYRVMPFRFALESAQGIQRPEERLDALRYLSTIAMMSKELEGIVSAARRFKAPEMTARTLGTAAGRADKLALSSHAQKWLIEGLNISKKILNLEERAVVRQNIAMGLARAGLMSMAKQAFLSALSDSEKVNNRKKGDAIAERIRGAMRKLGIHTEVSEDREAKEEREIRMEREANEKGEVGVESKARVEREPEMERETKEKREGRVESKEKVGKESEGKSKESKEGKEREKRMTVERTGLESKTGDENRHVLALYDAYEGGLKPAHFRAVARAAPLCFAFGLDLALVGFPTSDLNRIVEEIINETNIGKGGRVLKNLVSEGRVYLIPADKKNPPKNWPGIPVATTSHPDPEKCLTLEKLTGKKRKERLCLVMGIGKRGLPPSLLKSAPHHLELTGKNVPLETCTVMGIIAERLRGITEKKRTE